MKILLADDHALFRRGLCDLLRQLDGEVVFVETHDWQTTLEMAQRHTDCDIALVDLRMPALDGHEGLARVLDAMLTTPVVVITASESHLDMKRVLDSGASGYLAKSETPQIMLSALRLVLSGGVYVPPRLIQSPRHDGGVATKKPGFNLTPRQYEVLMMLVDGKSNKEIARQLQLTTRTVKAHVGAIFKALNVNNRQQAIAAIAHVAD